MLLVVINSNVAKANKIQLAYLQIEAVTCSDTTIVSNSCYQGMWKQPAATGNAPLSLQFSQGVKFSKKAAPALLNGANIQSFTLITSQSLADKTLTIFNLEKTDVEVMLNYKSIDNDYSVRLTPARPSYTFVASPSSWQTIQSYVVFGIEHILAGYDHLLFVLCLLLIASTVKKLLWAITGFTLAHSITLVLSTLNLVQLPILVVEAVIALSIVFLATEIVKNTVKKTPEESLTYRYPVAVSSSFGLLHGFGFASVLLELGLPKNDQFLALAFFNVGVEIGQLLFIASVILVIFSVKRLTDISKAGMKKVEKINAYLIGSIASMWLIERVMLF
ncbi:HupE/UreJ family protein [Colwellia sp. TT2012]|uniref:HupE/UreJ family protein n=1 Tax=Colwellia sp. TT2012 TaxID=1720342 RepID=UPI00070E1109|nr:HupE/UreJ family protein [Colwellia sp. TT2012]